MVERLSICILNWVCEFHCYYYTYKPPKMRTSQAEIHALIFMPEVVTMQQITRFSGCLIQITVTVECCPLNIKLQLCIWRRWNQKMSGILLNSSCFGFSISREGCLGPQHLLLEPSALLDLFFPFGTLVFIRFVDTTGFH
jgi:hypothetical protein